MNRALAVLIVVLAGMAPSARADFGGPQPSLRAVSPNGDLIVRVTTGKATSETAKETPLHTYRFYSYDAKSDSYKKGQSFRANVLGNLMYVSNQGEIVLVVLDEKNSLRLLARDGKIREKWDIKQILTKKQLRACAETGSTLQWFNDGEFVKDTFYFRGPSQVVRALSPPYTLMRGADLDFAFSGEIDAKSGQIEMHK